MNGLPSEYSSTNCFKSIVKRNSRQREASLLQLQIIAPFRFRNCLQLSTMDRQQGLRILKPAIFESRRWPCLVYQFSMSRLRDSNLAAYSFRAYLAQYRASRGKIIFLKQNYQPITRLEVYLRFCYTKQKRRRKYITQAPQL